jgi:hypothetical protein
MMRYLPLHLTPTLLLIGIAPYIANEEAKIIFFLTKTKLAKKMHASRSSLNQLLDPEDEAITFKTLKKAATVLEIKLVIQLS